MMISVSLYQRCDQGNALISPPVKDEAVFRNCPPVPGGFSVVKQGMAIPPQEALAEFSYTGLF